MTTYDPSTAPRSRESGYKGDAWTVSIAPDDEAVQLLLDTGIDSIAIVRIPDAAWDRGPGAVDVHRHPGYDEAVLLPRGAGTLYSGPHPTRITATPFEGPVTLMLPAGCWHHVRMDEGVEAPGTAFYTVPGTVIAKFTTQMDIVTRATVPFASLPVVHPAAVQATQWRAPVVPGVGDAPLPPAPVTDPPAARILPYATPADTYELPLDTGTDSLFLMASVMPPIAEPPPFVAPELVDVHRHPDVDEVIIRPGGAGYILNGPTPEGITLTPFRGPCVMVMPAGAFHRIVHTEEATGGDGILLYSDRRAVVEPFATIMARTDHASIDDPAAARTPG